MMFTVRMTNSEQVSRHHEWTIGDRLRVARESVTYDKKQFAEMIGISRDTLRHYERGQTSPRPPVLTAWCLATGFDKEWILTGTISNPTTPGVTLYHERRNRRDIPGRRNPLNLVAA